MSVIVFYCTLFQWFKMLIPTLATVWQWFQWLKAAVEAIETAHKVCCFLKKLSVDIIKTTYKVCCFLSNLCKELKKKLVRAFECESIHYKQDNVELETVSSM